MRYETKRKPRTVRKAASTSHSHAAFRQTLPHCGSRVESVPKFCSALVSNLSEEGPTRHSEPGQMGAALPIGRTSERTAEEKAAERSRSSWAYHRPMDVKAYRTTDSGRLRSPLYARGGMETVAPQFWVELSEARETRSSKRRKGHSLLEEKYLAPYKKKPKNLGPTWRSWTKAGSCSYRLYVKPGLRRVRRQSCATVTAMKKSRPLAALRYLPDGSALDFSSNFMPITSPAGKSSVSCSICCVICVGMWCLSGTVAPSIRERMLRRSWKRPDDFMSIDFPAMHRNSIRLNTFGRMVSATFLTAHTKTRIAWALICVGLLGGFAVLSSFFSRVLNTRSFLGREYFNVSIIC